MTKLQLVARVRDFLRWKVLCGPPGAGRRAPGPVRNQTALLGIPERHEFVCRAYQAILGRAPSPDEELRQVRRLRFLKFFYTRRRFLARLSASWEAQAYRLEARRARDEAAAERVERLLGRAAEESRVASAAVSAALSDALAAAAAETQRAVAGLRAAVAPVADLPELRAAVAPVAELAELSRRLLHGQDRAVQVAAQAAARASETREAQHALAGELAGLRAAVAPVADLPELRAAVAPVAELAELSRRLLHGQDRAARAAEQAVAQAAAQAAVQAAEAQGVGRALLARQEARAFAEQAWFGQLRWLGSAAVEHLRAELSPPSVGRGDPAPGRCRVCGAGTEFRWRLPVLHDRYQAEYHECGSCRALQVADPHWLDEAYRGEAEPGLWNPDPGRLVRNFTVYGYLRALSGAGLVGRPTPRVLDFGGGNGMLVQMLVSGGVDAWMLDPFVARPSFAPDRLITRPEDVGPGSVDLIAAVEVFEHLTDPGAVGAEFRRVLRPGGAVFLSTTVYRPGEHGPDWAYLSREAGQHVLFWSREALRAFASRFGFRSAGFLPDCGFGPVVLSDLPAEDLGRVLAEAAARVRADGFLDRVARDWLLVPRDGAAGPPTDVEAVGAGGGEACAS